MAKKIRFLLEMADGNKVSSLTELKEYFSLEKVMVYYSDGKLVTWLRDRYEDDIADEIEALDNADSELPKKLCAVFGVEYNESDAVDLEKAAERERKLKLLKEYTDEQKYLDNVESVAFDQDDMYNLLDEGVTSILLCGDKFSIPLGKNGISYIGVNNPIVVISSKEIVDWESKAIIIENVRYDEAYQKILDVQCNVAESKSIFGGYTGGSYLNFMLSPKETAAAENCYKKVNALIGSTSYDIDDNIANIKRTLKNNGFAGAAEDFINGL